MIWESARDLRQVQVLLALWVLLLCGCKGDADFSAAMPEVVTLSAEDYRAEITGIDRLVFEEGPFGKERSAALSTTLQKMAHRVKATSDSRFLALEALEIRRLAAGTGGSSSPESRARLSREWMRIRNNLFDDRSWFARSAADLEPASPAPAPVTAPP